MLETKILILFSPLLLAAEAQNGMFGDWFYPGPQPSPWFGYESSLMDTLYGYECEQPNGYYPIVTSCDCYVECRNSIATTYRCPEGLYYTLNTRWPEFPCHWVQAQNNRCDGQPAQQPTPCSENSTSTQTTVPPTQPSSTTPPPASSTPTTSPITTSPSTTSTSTTSSPNTSPSTTSLNTSPSTTTSSNTSPSTTTSSNTSPSTTTSSNTSTPSTSPNTSTPTTTTLNASPSTPTTSLPTTSSQTESSSTQSPTAGSSSLPSTESTNLSR